MEQTIFIIIVILIVSIFLMRWAHKKGIKEKSFYENEAIKKLHGIYKSLKNDISEYSIYTTGHPYVWVSSNQIKMESDILSTCRYGDDAVVYYHAFYSIKINENNKSIYYVTLRKNFDFNSLMHYQEWLDSQKQVAQNIAKHKNS